MLTVADKGEEGVKFAKILLTSYVNTPQRLIRYQKWEMFRNFDDVAVKLWFYILYIIQVRLSISSTY